MNKKEITKQEVERFEMFNQIFNGIYNEFHELAKKKPESILNTYKVKILNRTLNPIKDILSEEKTLEFLDIFDSDDLPNNSDVVLVLSHYEKAMNIFRKKYSHYEFGDIKWNIKK